MQTNRDSDRGNPAVARVEGLEILFHTRFGTVQAVDGATLTVGVGEKLGVVGESGSGKTTMAMAFGHLLPVGAKRVAGDVTILDRSVFALDDEELRQLRRRDLAYIFQDPVATLDPTMRIRRQLVSALAESAERIDIEGLLAQVGLSDAKRIVESYPHELSGGMSQRVSIAMAIARHPRLIVADEPTAALDASIRGQILNLLMSLCEERQTSLVLLSHDLRAVARHCDTVAVMYGGAVVESGPSGRIFQVPAHPYSSALLCSAPGVEGFGGRIEPISGVPPLLTGPSTGCAFAPRCGWAQDRCYSDRPVLREVAARSVACHRAEEVVAKSGLAGQSREGGLS